MSEPEHKERRSSDPTNEVLAERIEALDEHLSHVEDVLNKRINDSDKNLREHIRHQVQQVSDALTGAQREQKIIYEAQEKATTVALDAATKLAETHNDLIRQMERKDATYSTSKELQDFKDEREHRLDDLRDTWTEKLSALSELTEKSISAYKLESEKRFKRIEDFQLRLGTVAVVLAVIGVTNLIKLWFG